MSGHILLEGGSEFGGQMAAPDRRAIELAGGYDIPICIIPTAAAPDHNDRRAGQNGVRWFEGLGARQVSALPLTDQASANDESIAGALRTARFIYLLGGFPGYLARTLKDSLSWEAILEAYRRGAVIGGSSAGAMVLCEYYYDPDRDRVESGFDLLPNACIVPHHDAFGRAWVPRLAALLPGARLIGIDEQTGMIDDDAGGRWNVHGKGTVTVYTDGQAKTFRPGELAEIE